jgi:fatty acid desaturase/nitrite reductase/ring-hydroxylating ferredoxin subunit
MMACMAAKIAFKFKVQLDSEIIIVSSFGRNNMATQTKRDYALSGGYDGAVALDDDQLETKVESTWWHPRIERKELKALMTRSDTPALMHFGLWILLLLGSGYLAILTWGTWWALPAFLLYGTIYSSSDSRWHECGHGTPFKTRWLNEVFYHISSFMTLREAFLWRWSHSRHHTNTIIVGLDPEIQVKRPADLVKILLDFFNIMSGPPEVWRIIRHAFGNPNSDVRNFVPEEERWKMYWSSRVYVGIFVVFGIWSYAIGSFLPMMFIGLPRFYGGWLHQLLGLTQHAGLGEDTYDHRENTRTVYVNPVFRYLYMNMNYHLEHHTIPMIPYHALPKLHEAIKDQTPTPYPNLWAVYKEMIPALIKQATEDPNYTIKRDIPVEPVIETLTPVQQNTGTVAVDNWVEACAFDALEVDDVLSFSHTGKLYAIYRLQGDTYHASDALCTHEQADLTGGLVINGCIECPLHNGRFNIADGKAVKAPARKPLNIYPTERRGDKVFINIGEKHSDSSSEQSG